MQHGGSKDLDKATNAVYAMLKKKMEGIPKAFCLCDERCKPRGGLRRKPQLK